MKFRTYPKIHRLGKEETDGILDGPVTIQEKVDGANVSIWYDNGEIKCGSRTRELGDDEFNGFTAYVKEHEENLKRFFEIVPTVRLYGEWLVKHTITYPDEAYKRVYLYDMYDDSTDEYYPQRYVKTTAQALGFEYPHIFVEEEVLTEEKIKEYVGLSTIGASGEGVVIKRQGFKNKWGNHCYAKLVTEHFKESNAIVFGGNNKHSETYWEMYVVNKYCTMSRVTKIMQKLQPEVNERLDMKHTSEIAGRAYYDLIMEEIWEIVTKVPALNFKKLKTLCSKKFIQIYHDILNNSISIADQKA